MNSRAIVNLMYIDLITMSVPQRSDQTTPNMYESCKQKKYGFRRSNGIIESFIFSALKKKDYSDQNILINKTGCMMRFCL